MGKNRGTRRLAERLEKEGSSSWESKLKPGAKGLLTAISEQFETLWDVYRQTIPADAVEKSHLKDLDWTDRYRDMQANQELLDIFVNPRVFAETAVAAIEHLKSEPEELFLSRMAFQTTVLFYMNGLEHPEVLFRKIRQGDALALFDFTKVDKTIVTHKYARERIRVAQISGDGEFFKRLGNALKHDPWKQPSKIHRRNYFLRFIAHLAIEHLTIPEVLQILEEACGIYEYDAQTVGKAWNRAGLHEIIPKREKKSDKKK
ncbi:hypothetical protein MYX82_10735 [Acidobacteria bacterium AH-259-D05]|nr:hypothetical protein [Acidobacteria bacterium AH-259-D05]